MNNVLIIGAGRGQVPIINICHNYGCSVFVVSPDGNYPGLNIADEICYADVRDYEKILEFSKHKKINAVLTDQLDAGVYTAAFIAEKLNLPGIGTSVASKFTNKYCMREAAEVIGIHVPKYIRTDNIDNLKEVTKDLRFPLMMKPLDSAASRGVYKVYSVEEIKKHFGTTIAYSKTGGIILEEFIEGKEYVVEAYTTNYQVSNLIVGHRDYFDVPDTFIPNATVFHDANSANSILEMKLKEINKKLVEAFRLPFGITHAEYLYSEKEDKIYLVEIAARGGGVFISSDLIPLACGINANELLVRDAIGLNNAIGITLKKGASAYFCYLTPEGTVCKLENIDKIKKIKGVHKAYFDNIELGMETGSIRDKSSRKGPILIKGERKDDCYNVISQVKDCLDIQLKTVNGIEPIIWN